MPLTKATYSSNLGWTMQKTNAGFASTVESGKLIFSLANLNLTSFNQLYTTQLTITAGNNQIVDLSSLTNLVGEAFGFQHILALWVLPTGSQVTLNPGPSNSLFWFFGTYGTAIVQPNDMFCYIGGVTSTGAVVNPTHKTLQFTNSGVTPLTLTLALLGGTS